MSAFQTQAVPSDGLGPSTYDYACLLLLGLMWGGAFMFTALAVESVPPATTVAGRLVIAAVLLAAIAAALGRQWPRGWRAWALITLSGIVGNALPFTLISWGQEEVPSGPAAILMGIMPLATLVLAHIFTADEKLNRYKIAGVFMGLIGLVVLVGPTKLFGLGENVVRELVIASAAISYGVNTLLTKALMGHDRIGLGAGVMLTSALVMVPVAFILDNPMALTPTVTSASSVLVLGIVQTALAALLMFHVVKRNGATFFSQINYLVPPIGLMYGAVFLSEEVTLNALMALVLIVSGIAIARRGMR